MSTSPSHQLDSREYSILQWINDDINPDNIRWLSEKEGKE